MLSDDDEHLPQQIHLQQSPNWSGHLLEQSWQVWTGIWTLSAIRVAEFPQGKEKNKLIYSIYKIWRKHGQQAAQKCIDYADKQVLPFNQPLKALGTKWVV